MFTRIAVCQRLASEEIASQMSLFRMLIEKTCNDFRNVVCIHAIGEAERSDVLDLGNTNRIHYPEMI
ncbi:hypothetical protein D3227_25800 [Mesorhizobium waimense]|uniref:Uncharacterized protein n=1 Tax=Mesorhizobium waimense TaxID=1300307 RepID=A0A3A5KCJ5_9HYPH|nr:hypothetical protein D3227_25800 [Mesorhizobium waimense]